MRRWAMCGGAALALSGCSSLTAYVADRAATVGTDLLVGGVRAGASATLPIGIAEERAYGGAIAVMIVQRYGGLYEDPVVTKYVQLVGQAVALHCRRPDLDWHFAVLDSDTVNALSAPGGYVFVTRGALAGMQDEAELAGVLAHEVGHIDARHALASIKELKAKSALAQAAADAWQDSKLFSDLLDRFLNGYLDHGLPPETEFEADQLATATLSRVGWQPGGLRGFLHRLADEEQKTKGNEQIQRTHPKTADRVTRLDAQLAAMTDRTGAALPARFLMTTAPLRPAASAPVVIPTGVPPR